MLKQVYIRVAQTIPAILPCGTSVYSKDQAQHSPAGRKWLASLGAIYHLDRMIALDIPWWHVKATTIVEQFLATRSNARIFEYGSGASTIWLARRAGSVTTVEHDAVWAEKLRTKLMAFPNVTLISAGYDANGHGPDQPYVRAIEGKGQFDLIVVDGRLRADCLKAAIPHLKQDGLILFDDSGRTRYRGAIENCGLAETHYHGLSYCVPYPDHSSLLTHSGPVVVQ